MRDLVLKSGWETFLFAVPFLGLLLAGLIRLDELISTPNGVLTGTGGQPV